jgi:hypothetical protein
MRTVTAKTDLENWIGYLAHPAMLTGVNLMLRRVKVLSFSPRDPRFPRLSWKAEYHDSHTQLSAHQNGEAAAILDTEDRLRIDAWL